MSAFIRGDKISEYLRRIKTGVTCLGLLTLMILLPVMICNGQQGDYDPVGSDKFTMPSPNASSLGEYGQVPVSKFTGIPNIQVPLYEIKVGNHTVPLSLSYHAGGVKVAENASSIGLGWSLNAGGAIVRTVRGEADETDYGFISTGYEVQSIQTPPDLTDTMVQKIVDEQIDTQPDYFAYNFLNQTGKMIYHPESSTAGEFLSIPKRSIDIDYGMGGNYISEWTITDESGTVYQFKELENSESFTFKNGSSSQPLRPTAWYLTLIKYTDGNEVEFKYTEPVEADTLSPIMLSAPITYAERIEIDGSATFNAQPQRFFDSKYHNVTYSKYLKEIITPSEKIVFHKDERSDHYLERRYSSIEIIRNGEPYRTFDLSQSYFNAGQGTFKQRLKLDSLGIDGDGDNSSKTYKFDYIEGELPARSSLATDHWGFYNGAVGNDAQGLVLPDITVDDIRSEGGVVVSLEGANKEPNSDFSDIGTLKKITYPTGGWTDFKYEPNTYGYIGNEEVRVLSPEYQNVRAYAEAGLDGSSPTLDSETKTISVPANHIVTVEVLMHPGAPWGSQGYYYSPDQSHLGISGPSANSTPYLPDIQENRMSVSVAYQGGETVLSGAFNDPDNFTTESYTAEIELEGGNTYTVTASASGYNDHASIEFDYAYKMNEEQEKVGGGLRIKEIITHDGLDHANDMVRSFEYVDKADTNRSSGSIIAEPRYAQWLGVNDNYWLTRYATSTSTAGPKGTNVVYERVVEKRGEEGEGGIIEQEFTSLQKMGVPALTYAPFQPLPNYGWQLGQPLTTKKYDNTWNPRQGMNSIYTTEATEEIQYLYYKPMITAQRSILNITANFGLLWFNEYKTGWKYLSEKNNNIYDNEGDALTTSVQIYRDDISHKQITKKVETNSNGQQLIKEYEYAHEQSSQYYDMETDHMLTQPYKVTTKDGAGNLLKVKWTLWDSYNGFWHPCGEWIGGAGLGLQEPTDC